MSRRWNLPLTYPPKIPLVQSRACEQTIRPLIDHKHKKCGGAGCPACSGTGILKAIPKKPGDFIRFFGWSGKPYRSPWVMLTEYFLITEVRQIRIFPTGIRYMDEAHNRADHENLFFSWDHPHMYFLSKEDGIVPATGQELGAVLQSKNKIPADGVNGQIIRWGDRWTAWY